MSCKSRLLAPLLLAISISFYAAAKVTPAFAPVTATGSAAHQTLLNSPTKSNFRGETGHDLIID
jgi:hypothetical protein